MGRGRSGGAEPGGSAFIDDGANTLGANAHQWQRHALRSATGMLRQTAAGSAATPGHAGPGSWQTWSSCFSGPSQVICANWHTGHIKWKTGLASYRNEEDFERAMFIRLHIREGNKKLTSVLTI
eukprot:1157575-Pelagomonas_calceolata.AAC.3